MHRIHYRLTAALLYRTFNSRPDEFSTTAGWLSIRQTVSSRSKRSTIRCEERENCWIQRRGPRYVSRSDNVSVTEVPPTTVASPLWRDCSSRVEIHRSDSSFDTHTPYFICKCVREEPPVQIWAVSESTVIERNRCFPRWEPSRRIASRLDRPSKKIPSLLLVTMLILHCNSAMFS